MEMKDQVSQKMVTREMDLRKVQFLQKTKETEIKKMKNLIQQMKPMEMKTQAPEKANQTEMRDQVSQNLVPWEMHLRNIQVLQKTKDMEMNKMKNWIQQMKPVH